MYLFYHCLPFCHLSFDYLFVLRFTDFDYPFAVFKTFHPFVRYVFSMSKGTIQQVISLGTIEP
jgi:hypothetical protein